MNLKNSFAKGPTTKTDIIMACAGALVGVWKAFDTIRDYKSEQEEETVQ